MWLGQYMREVQFSSGLGVSFGWPASVGLGVGDSRLERGMTKDVGIGFRSRSSLGGSTKRVRLGQYMQEVQFSSGLGVSCVWPASVGLGVGDFRLERGISICGRVWPLECGSDRGNLC